MRIQRREYCYVTYTYDLDVTDDYLKELKNRAKTAAVNPEVIPHITADLVFRVYQGDREGDFMFEYTHPWSDMIYKDYFYDWLYETLDEDLSDGPSYEDIHDCYDVERNAYDD